MPDIFPLPDHDEIHISCTLTWDKKHCEYLKYQWEGKTNKPVKLGGVAYGSPSEDFIQGMYLRPNIIFTTRGCNNNCPWCIVQKIEGKLRELPICQGNIIQDNNFLQASRAHKDKVFDMLRSQKKICFKGGLEADLVDDHFVSGISNLNISELWLACDTDGELPRFKKAVERLKRAGFNRNKIYCYALIGDDMDKNEARLREIYNAGAMPRAQLYQPAEPEPVKKTLIEAGLASFDKLEYSTEWKAFARMWQRPAATRAHMEKGTHYSGGKVGEVCSRDA